MKKRLILIIYDILGLLVIGLLGYNAFFTKPIVILSYEIELYDTIEYEGRNLYRGIQIEKIGGKREGFHYIDKYGNEISKNDFNENFNKYRRKYMDNWKGDNSNNPYRDSLIIDWIPRIAINKLTTDFGFIYKGDYKPPFYSYMQIMKYVMYLGIIIILILIRRIIQLTLDGKILSIKGVRPFKYLFLISVFWIGYKYLNRWLVFKTFFRDDFEPPDIIGDHGNHIYMTLTRNFDYLELYFNIIIIVSTFCLFQAFKYGQRVKSENDLTV